MKTIPLITIDLDLDSDERWADIPKSLIASGQSLARKVKSQTAGFGPVLGPVLDWLTKGRNPYRGDIEAWAKLLNVSKKDLYLANFSYELAMAAHVLDNRIPPFFKETKKKVEEVVEKIKKTVFGCTSGAAWRDEAGMVHLRTLDWEIRGMGRHNVVYHMVNAPAGDFYNIGFPGYVGVLTGFAPGRFSASINYATPASRPSLDWPPSHLLRHVFEECEDYEEALGTLESIPTGTPAMITLVGTKRNQAAIVECPGQKKNQVHPMTRSRAIAISNDYLSGELREERNKFSSETVKPEDQSSQEQNIFAPSRRNTLLRRLNSDSFKAARLGIRAINSHPIRNEETKLQAAMCPRTGEMILFGVENKKRVSTLVIG